MDNVTDQTRVLREALEAIIKVEVNGWDNIWTGADRCKRIAHKALAAAPATPHTPAPAIGVEPFLTQLRRVNTERYEAWVGDGEDAGILFDAAELGGEVGELLNVVKKLEREERGWRGSRASPEDFADECADVLICLDKLARRRGIDLEAATVAKFNATSDKQGFPHNLSTPAPAQPSEVEAIIGKAQFLCDRLDDLEWSDADLAATCSDYMGHVDPAHSRLKTALAEYQPNTPEKGNG